MSTQLGSSSRFPITVRRARVMRVGPAPARMRFGPSSACLMPSIGSRFLYLTARGVSAAGAAGVATPSTIFDLQGSSCVDDPRYFDKCFTFFPFAELQSTGHVNLKNNTPRMHHITPFRDCLLYTSPSPRD